MKIERIRVFGFEPAFHGMRNPKESWDRSDSVFYDESKYYARNARNGCAAVPWEPTILAPEWPDIGPKDMELACSLIKGGSEHRKFLRQIMVWFDITIPIYAWSELDTYKVATVRNSCSTMHKLGHRFLAQDDFEQPIEVDELIHLNELIVLFQKAQEEKSKELRNIRRKLKNDLASGYLQMATYMLSYETVLAILKQRHKHRLDEWHWEVPGSICNVLLTLPYVKTFAEAMMGPLVANDHQV
jgi:hypothetical protein